MTCVQIDLPDALANEAKRAGLLASEKIAAMLRSELRAQQLDDLRRARGHLASSALPAMSQAEIAREIAAYRSEARHAGST